MAKGKVTKFDCPVEGMVRPEKAARYIDPNKCERCGSVGCCPILQHRHENGGKLPRVYHAVLQRQGRLLKRTQQQTTQ